MLLYSYYFSVHLVEIDKRDHRERTKGRRGEEEVRREGLRMGWGVGGGENRKRNGKGKQQRN